MATRVGLSAALAALLGCEAPPRTGGYEAGTSDAPEEVFSFCARGCPSGSVCVGVSCVPRDAGSLDAARDTGPPDTGPNCCPLDPPSCGCVQVGGARSASGTCPRVCDARPEGWVRGVDGAGCPVWVVPDLPCRAADAGHDAGAPDAL